MGFASSPRHGPRVGFGVVFVFKTCRQRGERSTWSQCYTPPSCEHTERRKTDHAVAEHTARALAKNFCSSTAEAQKGLSIGERGGFRSLFRKSEPPVWGHHKRLTPICSDLLRFPRFLPICSDLRSLFSGIPRFVPICSDFFRSETDQGYSFCPADPCCKPS